MSAPSYPWVNLLVYFEDLMRRLDLPAAEAVKRVAGNIHAGRLEITSLVPVRSLGKLRLSRRSRDRLKVETPDGPLDADQFEVRQRPIPVEPDLPGPTAVPVTGELKLKEQIAARIRELGGSAYVASSSGVALVVSTTEDEPIKPAGTSPDDTPVELSEPNEPPVDELPKPDPVIPIAADVQPDIPVTKALAWIATVENLKGKKKICAYECKRFGVGSHIFHNQVWLVELKRRAALAKRKRGKGRSKRRAKPIPSDRRFDPA